MTAPPQRLQLRRAPVRAQRGARRARSPTSTTAAASATASSTTARAASPPRCSALGVRREERVLLLMHDTNDWPVAFLGALYAGVVPVAVNTLLTADDYAYMLAHSRAQAALVSARAAAGARRGDGASARTRCGSVDRVAPAAPPAAGAVDFDALLAQRRAAAPTPAATARATTPRSGSIRRARPAGPRARCTRTPTRTGPPSCTASAVLGLREGDVCFSAAKLFFAYGLGNALTFPLAVGATTRADGRAADARRRLQALAAVDGVKPTVFFGAPTGYRRHARVARRCRRASEVALRLCVVGRRGAAGARSASASRAHFGCEILDGIGSTEMLHIFLSNRPGDVRYGTTGKPVPGYEIELRGDDGRPVADGEVGDLYINGPSAALMYWGNREKTRATFQGGWTKSGDKYVRDADGYYTYAGRSDDMLKVSGIYVSPFEVEATLMQHPAVLEAAVIGIEDADGLTKTKAFVVSSRAQRRRATPS